MIRRIDPMTAELAESERPASSAPVRSAKFYVGDGHVHGVWEAEPGVHEDYSGPETVVVLKGRATVVGASGVSVDVGPGDLVIVESGEKTTWTVHETIRKVFVVNG